MNQTELKPCPFCGGEAQFREIGRSNDWLMIECANPYDSCSHMKTSNTESEKKRLTEKWNRRYTDAIITNLLIEQSECIWNGLNVTPNSPIKENER